MHTGQSSQPHPRSSPLSQKHHGVELNFILIHLSGYGEVHPQDEWIIQPTGSIILAQIKKFYQMINTQCKDGPGYLSKSTSAIFNRAHVETG